MAEEKKEDNLSPFAKNKKKQMQQSGPAKMRSTHVSTMPPAQNLFGRLIQTMNVANTQNVRDQNPGWDIYAAAKRASKVEKVMGEYKRGKLRSGSKTGPKVKSRDQAIAIALSEAREAGEDVPEKKSEVKTMKISEFSKIAAKITAEKREKLPKSDFGLKNKADTKKEKSQSGNYPIDTKGRARAALAYSKRYASPGQQATIRKRVEAKYPKMEVNAEDAYWDGVIEKLAEAGFDEKQAQGFLEALQGQLIPGAAGGRGILEGLGNQMMSIPRWIGRNPGTAALGAMAAPVLAAPMLGAGLLGKMFPQKQTMAERLRGGAGDLMSRLQGLF